MRAIHAAVLAMAVAVATSAPALAQKPPFLSPFVSLYVPSLATKLRHEMHQGEVAVQFAAGVGGLPTGYTAATALINNSNFFNMPAFTKSILVAFRYSSTSTFPAQGPSGRYGRGYMPIIGNIDTLGHTSFDVAIMPPGSLRGVNNGYPVLSITWGDSASGNELIISVPNMIIFDGRTHTVVFSINVVNGIINFDVVEDKYLNYSSVTVFKYNNQLRINPIPAYYVPMTASPNDGTPYTWFVGSEVTSAASVLGVVPTSPSDAPGLHSFDGKLSLVYLWPNIVSPFDAAATASAAADNNVFQHSDLSSTSLAATGTDVLYPGQTPAPIFLEGDETDLGFGFNQGDVNGIDTSFVLAGPQFAPPGAAVP